MELGKPDLAAAARLREEIHKEALALVKSTVTGMLK